MNAPGLLIALASGLLVSAPAAAVDITVSGLFPNKALVQIDGGALQTLTVGQKTPQGILLVAVDGDSATFEIEGSRVTVGMGKGRNLSTAPSPSAVHLTADMRGHFLADGQINGQPVKFIVDTGATLVMLTTSEAQRLAIDYRKGARASVGTANGRINAYRVKIDSVTVGYITLYGIEAAVTETDSGPNESLLGMSFLNRTDMERKGNVLTLVKRY
jgi:aspartyl protease family protein